MLLTGCPLPRGRAVFCIGERWCNRPSLWQRFAARHAVRWLRGGGFRSFCLQQRRAICKPCGNRCSRKPSCCEDALAKPTVGKAHRKCSRCREISRPLASRTDLVKKRTHSMLAYPVGLVPLTGIEPVWCCHRGILSPLRLPIPPQRRVNWLFYCTIPGL